MPKSYGTPGPRILSPDCCTSQSLSGCSLGAQLLFDRMLVQADDQGRQQADPHVIKGACFPVVADVTAARVRIWMAELVKAGMVRVYASGKVQVAQLLSWWKYQSGARRAYPSRWDAPGGWTDRVYGLPKGEPAGDEPADSGQDAGSLPANRPDIPPLARGGPLPVAVAVTSAVAVGGNGRPPDDLTRHGLPHIDVETATVAEAVTGRAMTTIHGWPATELDRLVEDRTPARVQASMRRAAEGLQERPSWEQLVDAIRTDLEPRGGRNPKSAPKGGVSAEEAESAFRRS